MSLSPHRKHKIELSDYNYSPDIETRLFFANLTVFDIKVLKEIIYGSLKITITQLADSLEIDEEVIFPILDKLSASKLFCRMNDLLVVDKAKRKQFETQILKFQEDYEPGMEFLKSLLSHVPIHVLPSWYSIPKTSDHIFNSIIDKYLLTPKIYEGYQSELIFDDPILHSISREVFEAPDFIVKAQTLMEKYHLTPEQFEKKMLVLEYHLICCLNYRLVEDNWEEIVTPFSEWHNYLRFRRETDPKPIEDISNIHRLHPHDFSFVKDLGSFLGQLKKQSITMDFDWQSNQRLSQKNPPYLASALSQQYSKYLAAKTLQLKLTKLKDNQLNLQSNAKDWLDLPLQEQALTLYRQPSLRDENWATDRDIREIEKSLKRILKHGWIYYEDFLKGFTADIGRAETVTLKNKGKRWKYTLPSYLEQELDLIKITLFGRLFEAGLVAVGTHEGKLCFCITPFGRRALE